MKKQIIYGLIFSASIIFGTLYAQSDGFLYKMAVKQNGNLLINTDLVVKVGIIDPNNGVEYIETHNVTTDAYGLATLVIGEGNSISGDFSSILWNNVDKTIKVEISTDGGNTFKILNTDLFPVKYMPYAKFAQQGINSVNGFNDLSDARNYRSGIFLGEKSTETTTYTLGTVAIGRGAMESWTSINTENIAIGYDALSSMTVGKYNVVVGSEAMSDGSIVGDENAVFGCQAMKYFNSPDTLGGNTVIGAYAAKYVTNVEKKVAVGAFAGYQSPSNVSVGYSASYHNVLNADNKNVALGAYALYGQDGETGYYNVAVGYKALYNNERNHNVAIGSEALYNNGLSQASGGNGNTAIGYKALYENKDGNNNIAIGAYAGYNGYSYVNSIAIGYNCNITASNQVRLGNSTTTSIGGYVNWENYSDARFKRDVREDVPGLDLVLKLRPVTYHMDMDAIAKWHNTPDGLRLFESEKLKESELQIGFIAQEVEQAANELNFDFYAVDKPDNPKDPYGLRYSMFVPVITQAVKEFDVLLQEEKKQHENVRNELKTLDRTIGQLQQALNELNN
jgi:hypothetical protein